MIQGSDVKGEVLNFFSDAVYLLFGERQKVIFLS